MKISISQVYIEADANFPFSYHMQMWVSDEISAVVPTTPEFDKQYGPNFEIIVNSSARKGLKANEIKGPAVYKKTKTVEYTLFLPYDVISANPDGLRAAANLIVTGVEAILTALSLDPAGLDAKREAICEHLATDPTMLTAPWPVVPT